MLHRVRAVVSGATTAQCTPSPHKGPGFAVADLGDLHDQAPEPSRYVISQPPSSILQRTEAG